MTAAGEAAVEPILLLGEGRRRLLNERLTESVDRWYRMWAPERAGDVLVELSEARSFESAMPVDGWMFAAEGAIGSPWLQIAAPADFLRILSGVGPTEGVFTTAFDARAGDLAVALTEDILAVLCREFPQPPGAAKAWAIRRLESGALNRSPAAHRQVAVISVARGRVRALLELSLSPEFIDACLGPRPTVTKRESLVARRHAVAEQATVRIRAVLGQTLVSWQDLNVLAIGDVIVLDQSLSAACSLQAGESTSIADLQLGHVDSVLAAQITNIRKKAG